MVTAVGAGKIEIPANLARLLPPTVLMFWNQIPFSKWFGIALGCLILYGPIVGPQTDHNGWRWLVTPLVCPLIIGFYYRFWPPNVYSGYSALRAGLHDLDKRDPDASRLIALFRSSEAHEFIWRTVGKVTLIELSVMGVLGGATAAMNDVSWSGSASWLWQGVVGCLLGSFLAIGSDVFAWVLRSWLSNSAAH